MHRLSDTEKEIKSTPTLSWPTQVVRADGPQEHNSAMPLEEPLSVEVNGQRVAVLMRLPGGEKELALGFCISEGIIAGFEDVLIVRHCGSDLPAPAGKGEEQSESRNRVHIHARPESLNFDAPSNVLRLIRSGCGAVNPSYMTNDLPRLNGNLGVSVEVLLGLNASMRQAQELYKLSGGVHAAAIFDAQGCLLALEEDIGRHNAIDKVIGYCLLRGIPLRDHILVATGRASHEMVTKSVRVGIAVVASISAATTMAAQIAEDRGVTLIGYLRSKRMSVYTHPWRIEG